MIRIEGHLTAERYCSIISDDLLPYARQGPFPNNDFIFQQDLSPIHTSRRVKLLFEQESVEVMEWVPKSPDFNIIENVWGNMKVQLSRRPLHRANGDELWQAVKEEWERLQQDNSFSAALYASLPDRMAAAIHVRGSATRY